MKLKNMVSLENGFSTIKTVGGADVSYADKFGFCSIVILNLKDMTLVEKLTSKSRINFPYVPTFLSFREAEPITRTYKKMRVKPDVLLIDGHGIAHPRGLGLASHVGVILEAPTIGVAKNPLVGDFRAPTKPGVAQKIFLNGAEAGFALKTLSNARPIFISPGHMVSLNSSLRIVRGCLMGHKLPEPLRLAHVTSKKASKG